MGDQKPTRRTFEVNERVTHIDKFPGGTTLPMTGTIVGVEVKYIVEWDADEPSPISGFKPLESYPAEDLVAIDV